MAQAQIPDKLAERLNALMRPAKDVDRLAVMRTILATVADQPKGDPHVAALAYVFDNRRYAHLSGPKTPASAYQQPFDRDGRDRADVEATIRDGSIPLRIISLMSGCAAERVGSLELARRTLALLDQLPTTVAKCFALGTIADGAQLSSCVPVEVRFNTPLPDEAFRGILWRNRVALAAAEHALTDGDLRTKGAIGHAFLATIGTVADPEERANVCGQLLSTLRGGSRIETIVETVGAIPISSAQLQELLAQIAREDRESEHE